MERSIDHRSISVLSARVARPFRVPALVLAFVLVCLLSALPGRGAAEAQVAPAPATPPVAAADDLTGLSGGLLPRADGVQAAAAVSTEGAGGEPVQTPIAVAGGPGQLLLSVLLVLVSLALTVVAGTTLWWMLHAWRTPGALAATGFTRRDASRHRSFSLLLPARHEQAVLGDTLDSLAALDHPDYEVIAIIGHDDPETEEVARAAERRHPTRIRVVIDHNVPKNKPKALNTALPQCCGEITGVFDAEDEVHPGLLRLVEARFEEADADVVQAGVQLMNVHSSWWSLRNCLEYYFWFRSRL
ncbi:MAG: glycosyltransferase XagB, partial [Pseudonocardiales bacterium]|nr:glycosyltransferase XagB [Pseudonocardiales bacterium]